MGYNEINKPMSSEIALPQIKKISDIFQDNLCIPHYQRPYRWKAEKHVKQLIEDIERELFKKTPEYRIGSIILHNENIVDGQQRLVTLTLILLVLGYDWKQSLLDQEFKHIDSKNNIKHNYGYIKNYFRLYTDDKKELIKNFVLDNCTSVVIKLINISEAFQLFDSQNARGRSLEPADLLKAFHLREMSDNTTTEKKICVKIWEQAINEGLLNDVIGKYLFRIRKWKNKEWNYYFTKDEIDEFKGISIIRTIKEGKLYPFVLISMQNSMSVNFQINESIVNGIRFFKYIDHYVQMYKEIKSFQENVSLHGLNFSYSGWYRIGDRRIKTVFLNILMCYLDKFGKDECFVDFSKDLYRWAYLPRLTQTQIRYQTILKLFEDDQYNPIQQIDSWYYPEIQSFRRKIRLKQDIQIKKENREIEECITTIEEAWKR